MAWKCSKCGMPNYKEGNCVLCGEPMPENPEEYVDPKKKKADEPFLPDTDVNAENDVAAKPQWGVVEDTPKKSDAKPASQKAPLPAEKPVAPSPRTAAPAAKPATSATKPAVPAPKPVTPAPKTSTAPKKSSVSAPKKKKGKGSAVVVLFIIIALSAVCIGLYTMIQNLQEEPKAVIKQSAKPSRTATLPPSAEPSFDTEPSFDPYADPIPSASGMPSASDAPSVSTAPGVVPSGSPAITPSVAPSATAEPAVPTVTPKKTAAPKKTATPKKTAAPKKTATPAPAKTPAPTPKPASSLPSKPSAPISSDYKLYTNSTYGFSCAYPDGFYTDGTDKTALVSLRSSDYTSFMNIRAEKHDGSSAEAAMNNYLAYYGAPVLSKECGDNWYIAVFVQNDRVFYRKAYIDGNNLICFDFSCRQREYDSFASDLAYIGTYFYKN